MTKKTTIAESKIYQKLAGKNKVLACNKKKIIIQKEVSDKVKMIRLKQKLLFDINNILQSKYNVFDYTRDRAIQLFVAFKCGVLKRNKKYVEKDIAKMKIGTAKTRSLSSFLGFLEINKLITSKNL